MRNSHVAFFTYPHPPHVNPMLPVVSTLVRRGHRVSFVTSKRFESMVSALGAEVVGCPALASGAPDPAQTSRQPSRNAYFFQFTDQTLADVASYYAENRPNLILYDYMFIAGRILASRLGVPAIQTSSCFTLDRERVGEQVPSPEYRQFLLSVGNVVNAHLESKGVPGGNFLFHRERLNLFLYPQLLQLPGNASDGNCFYAGRCPGERLANGNSWKNEAGGRPVALLSASTTYVQTSAHFKVCIEALHDLGWHVVISVGARDDLVDLEPLPAHFEIVRNIGHTSILPFASLFIFMGGLISTAEAMYHGVSVIMMTHGHAELEWHADHFQRLGIGIHLKKEDANPDELRRAILRIAQESSIRNRVRDVQYIVRREPGAEETSNRIEEYESIVTDRAH